MPGENFPKLITIIHDHLRRFLTKELHDYTEEQLIESIEEAVNQFHDEEMNAYLRMVNEGNFEFCNSCGKCCKTYNIVMTEYDIMRLGKKINPIEYIKTDPTRPGKFIFKDVPCKFLKNNNRCSIYHYRPQSCRNYPLIAEDGGRLSRDPQCTFILQFFTQKSIAILKQRYKPNE